MSSVAAMSPPEPPVLPSRLGPSTLLDLVDKWNQDTMARPAKPSLAGMGGKGVHGVADCRVVKLDVSPVPSKASRRQCVSIGGCIGPTGR